MNPYSKNKAIYFIDRLRGIKSGEQPSPIHLYLYLSDLCNHNCSFCAYRQDGYTTTELFISHNEDGSVIKNPNRMLTLEKVISILDDAALLDVKAIQFTGGGEPTLHPNFAEIVDIAHALGIETSLVTNGSRLNERAISALMKSSWVRISLDAGTKETYKSIRQINKDNEFENVLANVKALVKERDRVKSDLYIGISFVVTKDNWEEIPLACDLANGAGADSIRYASRFTNENDDYYKDFGDEAEALIKKEMAMRANESTSFNIINSLSERRDDLRLGSPDYDRCAYQQLATFIGADMNLYTCCCNAYNNRGLIGSIKDCRFLELWNSKKKEIFMSTFNARNCERCQFNLRNREINTMIDSLPDTHVNFI